MNLRFAGLGVGFLAWAVALCPRGLAATDARVPNPDPRAARALAAGDAAVKAGAWAEAARAYQSLLESEPAALCAIGAGHFVGARHLARLRLQGLPPEGRVAYRACFDASAKTLFERGHRERDARALSQVARLYALSSFGVRAWDLLGELAWERGRTEEALAAFRNALRWGASEDAAARLHGKIALCLARAGRLGEAADALKTAREKAKGRPLGAAGNVPEAPSLDGAWLRSIAGEPPEGVEPAGELGSCVWRRALWQPTVAGGGRGPHRPWAPLMPVLAGGLVVVPSEGGLDALDELTGRTVWQYEASGSPPAATAMWLNEGGGPYGASAGAGSILGVFAQHAQSGASVRIRHRIHALDAATGRLRYILGGPSPEDALLDRLSFCALPVESDGVLYTVAYLDAGFSDLYALAFDGASGRLLWRTYLFSGECPHARYFGPTPGSPLTLADGFLFFSSNSGAAACLDVADGSVAWVHIYERTGAFWETRDVRPVAVWPGWRNAPLVRGDTVLVMPCDGAAILGLDATTGARLWERPRGDHVFVLGASRGVVVLAGREVEGIELRTGTTAWRQNAGEARGLGAVRGDVALCPTERGLASVDIATGREVGCRTLPAGHYLAGDAVCLVAGPRELACYYEPSRIVERARERIGADPRSLTPRYRLAVALSQSHEAEQAAAELRRALPLCRGSAEPMAGRVREAAWEQFVALARRDEAAEKVADSAERYREAAEATAEPQRFVEAMLGAARCHRAARDWPGLVEIYQEIIEREPDTVYPFTPQVSCAASEFAGRAIREVLAREGPQLYAPWEAEARKLLEGWGGPTSRVLVAIRRYPNSAAARAALLGLAERAEREGRYADAARHHAGYVRRVGETTFEAAGAVLRLVACYEKLGQLDAARPLLRKLAHSDGPVAFPRADRAAIAALARTRLESAPYTLAEAEPDAPLLSRAGFPLVKRWMAKPPGLFPVRREGEPAPELDSLVFARDAGTLYALDAESGAERWRLAIVEEAAREQSATIRFHAGLLFLYGGRYIYAVAARIGVGRWMHDYGPESAAVIPPSAWEGRLREAAPSRPTFRFDADGVYAATRDGRVVCLEPATGEMRWSTSLPGPAFSELYRLGDRLGIVVLPGRRAVQLDAASGKVVRVTTLLEREPNRVPVWADNVVALADGERVLGFDSGDGSLLWSYEPRRGGSLAIERFGSRLVVLSTEGGLALVDAATGRVCAQRSIRKLFAYLRAGSDSVLFCQRRVRGEDRISVESYDAEGLALGWFTEIESPSVYDAVATQRHILVSARRVGRGTGPSPRDVLVLDRRTGATLGHLDISEFEPHLLARFVSAPSLILSTVHSVVDNVGAQRLVAFGVPKGAAPPEASRRDELLWALREGRITPHGRAALARRHVERGAFDEAYDVLADGLADPKLAAGDYLVLGDAMALARRAAAAAERPETPVYSLDTGMTNPLILDGFQDFDVADVRDPAHVERWRGPDDLSARVYFAYSRMALGIHVAVRDDVHCPGGQGQGDRIELILARWEHPRQQWGENDVGLGLAAVGRAEPYVWLGRLPDALRTQIRSSATRDEARKTTTYQILLPWGVIGRFAPSPGAVVDFAIAIYDDDGRGPKGALRWGLFEPALIGHLRLR